MKFVAFRMRIVPGRGSLGNKCAESDEKRREISMLTGIDKAPGSLNLRFTKRTWLRKSAGIRYSQGLLYLGRIGDIDVAFTRPITIDKPNAVRVYADRHLKDALGVGDGDHITLQVPKEAVARFTWGNEAVYALKRLRRALMKRAGLIRGS